MSNNTKTIVFTGDYHIYGLYDEFIKQYPDRKIFSDDIKDLVSKSDLSVFNLEDPITNSNDGCIKYGPYGVGSEESLGPIKKVGFKVATFATNHTYDMKNKGILDTINYCRKYDIEIVGAGLTKEDTRRVFYKNLGNYKIAILNFARKEFNIVSDSHGGANPLDPIDNAIDIKNAKNDADFIFVVVHEGVDLFHLPYPRLIKQMRFYVDMGADAIIIHHSRCISGYEIYKGKPIFYGLGNLIHLSKNVEEHKGILIKFTINENEKLKFDLHPLELDTKNIMVSLANDKRKREILEDVEHSSGIIRNDFQLKEMWAKHIRSKKSFYLSVASGWPTIFYRVAKKMRLQKPFEKLLLLNKRKYLAIWNIARCQAHYEAMNNILSNIFMEYDK